MWKKRARNGFVIRSSQWNKISHHTIIRFRIKIRLFLSSAFDFIISCSSFIWLPNHDEIRSQIKCLFLCLFGWLAKERELSSRFRMMVFMRECKLQVFSFITSSIDTHLRDSVCVSRGLIQQNDKNQIEIGSTNNQKHNFVNRFNWVEKRKFISFHTRTWSGSLSEMSQVELKNYYLTCVRSAMHSIESK